MERNDFEPVVDQIRPSAGTRARSALGLLVLAAVIGVVVAVTIAIIAIIAVITLNNAL